MLDHGRGAFPLRIGTALAAAIDQGSDPVITVHWF